MRRMLPLILFVGGYMLFYSAWAVLSGKHEFIFYSVVMVIVIGAVLVMHARSRLSTGVLWGLALWGLLHMSGGLVPIPREFMASLVPPEGAGNVLYNFRPWPWFPKYDQLTHAYGFGVATLAGWEALRAASRGTLRPTMGVCVALLCLGMGLGALNEVVEFAAVLLVPNTNVGGYMNTGWDLVSNLVGTIIAVVIIRLLPTGRRESTGDSESPPSAKLKPADRNSA
jgi:hypothetical protein